MPVSVSIIIPTHNRGALIGRTLNALQSQTFPKDDFEVIIVADGCTDKTIEVLNQYDTAFQLKVIEQKAQGPAVARNNGAIYATGWLLIFVDDDIEVLSGFIDAHVEAHQRKENRVVIGYLPPVLAKQTGFYRVILKEWWENMFLKMSQRDHRFNYRDLLSGNFSLSAKLFQSIGGFNTDFKCQEDYEIGYRLIKANAEFAYSPQAMGYHHETTELDRTFQRKINEGEASILFSKAHPELIATLPLLKDFTKGYSKYYSFLLKLIFSSGSLSDMLANALKGFLYVLEGFRMRRYWRALLGKLLVYWYLRGIANATRSFDNLKNLVKESNTDTNQFFSPLKVDIIEGIAAAEKKIDEIRPLSIEIIYQGNVVGLIRHTNGYERLRGIHLRSALANEFARPLVESVAPPAVIDSMKNDYLQKLKKNKNLVY